MIAEPPDAEVDLGISWPGYDVNLRGAILTEWTASYDGLSEGPLGRLVYVVRTLPPLGVDALMDLARQGVSVGPALARIPRAAMEIVVSVGTLVDWQCPEMKAAGQRKTLLCPMPVTPQKGLTWRCRPDRTGTLTNPVKLRRALLEAADQHGTSLHQTLAPVGR